jgi:vacuolar-type H+-ATPase subunit I/STV1
MLKFLENLKPLNTFIVFTHCDKASENDEVTINEAFIKDKLESIKKYTKLIIPFENVVLFEKTSESLTDFIENMVKGKINVAENIDDLVEEFDEDLPEIATRIDQNEKTNLMYQLQLMQMLLDEYREEQVIRSR